MLEQTELSQSPSKNNKHLSGLLVGMPYGKQLSGARALFSIHDGALANEVFELLRHAFGVPEIWTALFGEIVLWANSHAHIGELDHTFEAIKKRARSIDSLMYGGSPSAISNAMIPKDHTSTLQE